VGEEASLHDEIVTAWESVGHMQNLADVYHALNTGRGSLKKWSMNKFASVTKELQKLRERIAVLSDHTSTNQEEELEMLRFRMDKLLYREEMMWLQQSRVAWLKEGDRNTKFFHMKVAGCAKKNKITRLRKEIGNLTQDKKEMEGMTRSFFQYLYKADPSVEPGELLQLIHARITPEMNESLCKSFSEEEISDALFHMGSLKAPRPDDFPAMFFQ
jgi:hypothetical protein